MLNNSSPGQAVHDLLHPRGAPQPRAQTAGQAGDAAGVCCQIQTPCGHVHIVDAVIADIRLPDMLYAAVKCCPVFGGDVKSYNFDAITGVEEVSTASIIVWSDTCETSTIMP